MSPVGGDAQGGRQGTARPARRRKGRAAQAIATAAAEAEKEAQTMQVALEQEQEALARATLQLQRCQHDLKVGFWQAPGPHSGNDVLHRICCWHCTGCWSWGQDHAPVAWQLLSPTV